MKDFKQIVKKSDTSITGFIIGESQTYKTRTGD